MYLLPKILEKLRPKCVKASKIDKTANIAGGALIYHSEIGRYSYVGSDSQVINAEVGAFCSIASAVMIGGGEHPLDFVSTSPVFHKGRNVLGKNFANHEFAPFRKTVIGNDVWIGHGALIKGGVKIATGAVIGMGAVVTKDVGPYEIWGGNPAKMIRKRFEDATIDRLLQSKWWEASPSKLTAWGGAFYTPLAFLKLLDK